MIDEEGQFVLFQNTCVLIQETVLCLSQLGDGHTVLTARRLSAESLSLRDGPRLPGGIDSPRMPPTRSRGGRWPFYRSSAMVTPSSPSP